jgi:hypothetical protein
LVTETNNIIRFPGRKPPFKGKAAAKCSCGLFSEEGLTDYSIRMWHRDHRLEILGISE